MTLTVLNCMLSRFAADIVIIFFSGAVLAIRALGIGPKMGILQALVVLPAPCTRVSLWSLTYPTIAIITTRFAFQRHTARPVPVDDGTGTMVLCARRTWRARRVYPVDLGRGSEQKYDKL